jgi:acetyl esterase/lipase
LQTSTVNLAPLLIAAALLAGCQPATLVNHLVPETGYTLQQGVPYGTHPRQRLDIYRPSGDAARRPVVVFVYGGSWDSGERGQYRFVGQALAERGYVTVIPDYRLHPEVGFPDFVTDVADAIEALPEPIGDLACADGRLPVAIAGHSAGAHTAALVALDPAYRKRFSDAADLVALVALAGPYDLPLQDPLVVGKFDDRPDDRSVKPVRLVGPHAPPTLLLHGNADSVVSPRHTEALTRALDAAGTDVETIRYPDLGHRMIVGALAKPLRFVEPVLDDIDRFLRERVGDAGCAQTHANSADNPASPPG